jgi:chorismate mutase
VGCLLIHGVPDRESAESSRGSNAIHGFFFASALEGDPMEHSVLEQALQAVEASDKRIVQLLTLRRHLATQLAHATADRQATDSLAERVAAVVSRLAPGNPGPLDCRRLAALFETVIRLTEPLCSPLAARNGAEKRG